MALSTGVITGVDRAVFMKYNTGALSTGAIRGENSGGPKNLPVHHP